MSKPKHFCKKSLKALLILAAIVLFIALFIYTDLKCKILLVFLFSFVYGFATA